jgi:hypothetical protein
MKYILLALLVGGTLTGCQTTLGIHERKGPKIAQSFNLNITKEQPLDIYFQKLSSHSYVNADIRAWETAQLFSSVKRTNLDQPSAHGYFLRVACQQDGWSEESGFLTGFLWLITAGTFPANDEISEESCKLTMYENGIQIASTTAYLDYRVISNGWLVVPYLFSSKSLNETHAQTAANIRVRKMMFALTEGVK